MKTSLFKAAEDSFQEPEELNSEVDYDVAASAFRDIKMVSVVVDVASKSD